MSEGGDDGDLGAMTFGAMIAFSTLREPQTEHVTSPESRRRSKAFADSNQLSNSCPSSHFIVYRIMTSPFPGNFARMRTYLIIP